MIFTRSTLELMPSQSLVSLSNALLNDKAEHARKFNTLNTRIKKLSGVYTMRNPLKGRVSVRGSSSDDARKTRDNLIGPALSIKNGVEVMQDATANPNSEPVFQPDSVEQQPTPSQLNALASEVAAFYGETTVTGIASDNSFTKDRVKAAITKKVKHQNEINRIQLTLDTVTEILNCRATGQCLEPKLNLGVLQTLPTVSDYTKEVINNNKRFIETQIIKPYRENQALLVALKAQVLEDDPYAEPTFDLVYGPPVSTKGQFILSEDGLYYDSRSGGLPPQIVPQVASSTLWDLEFPSNRGGRGVTLSTEEISESLGTIFDLNYTTFHQNNPTYTAYVKHDDVLQSFRDDKATHLQDVSGHLHELVGPLGYEVTDALVQNVYAQLNSVASIYDVKIKKREKQLALAASFGAHRYHITHSTDLVYGEGIIMEWVPSDTWLSRYSALRGQSAADVYAAINTSGIEVSEGGFSPIPRIPINDFSFFRGSGLSPKVDYQKKITLFSEDLDEVVFPHQPRFVVSPGQPFSFVKSLAVDEIGLGDWTHSEGPSALGARSFSSTQPIIKSITDDIVTDELLLCYNFLRADDVVQPSATSYTLNNAAEGSTRLNAKLVGWDTNFVFPSGTGIAYMGGTVLDAQTKWGTNYSQIKGSYAQLPNSFTNYMATYNPFNGSRKLDNLFYPQPKGLAFDFWTYVPDIESAMTADHRYRLILANENSNPVNKTFIHAARNVPDQTISITEKIPDLSKTHGMIMGFRDRGKPNSANSSGVEFAILPTVGQSQAHDNVLSNWGHSVCIAETFPASATQPTRYEVTELGMKIPVGYTTAAGKSIRDVSSAFTHFNVSFNYDADEILVHLDGELLATSSFATCFDHNPIGGVAVIPTKVEQWTGADVGGENNSINSSPPWQESFLGANIRDAKVMSQRVSFPVFTPWILGGGFTDNMSFRPDGQYSPLGFLGSNTNHTYNSADTMTIVTSDGDTYLGGQHSPPLSGRYIGRSVPRSGLDGFLGSFKIYTKPLNITDARTNYVSQQGFFKNIKLQWQ